MHNKIVKSGLIVGSLLAAISGEVLAESNKSSSQLFNAFWSPTRLGPLECRFGLLNIGVAALYAGEQYLDSPADVQGYCPSQWR